MEFRRTKIVATIGPASQSEEVLEKLFDAGINVARLNFSHGTHESHAGLFRSLRGMSEKKNAYLSILQDLCGPKIRLGEVKPGTVLKAGDTCSFTAEEVVGDAQLMHVSYDRLAEELKPGDRILLDDGSLECVVESAEGGLVKTKVTVGGPVSSHKGVNLPGAKLSVPALTAKDADDLRFGLKLGVDYVAMSFVRSPKDVEPARAIMEETGIHRPIIAKIEKPEALECIEEIVEAFDGIMVARGDLGVEMPIEEIPLAQKRIINVAREHFKPVICATQMLDSMIRNPRPTRAEVTDIANAIIDGVDAVMLSGETASGSYPVEAVEVMSDVARSAEKCLPYSKIFILDNDSCRQIDHNIALCACEIAEASKAKAILACTSTGKTVVNISHFRPSSLIIGMAHDEVLARQLNLYFGVKPAYMETMSIINTLLKEAAQKSCRLGYINHGDKIVAVAGFPLSEDSNLVCLTDVR